MINKQCDAVKNISVRLNRISGQISGIKKMVMKQKEPISIVNQITGAKRALEKIALMIIENYIENCLCKKDNKNRIDNTKTQELVEAIDKFIK